MSGLRAVKPDPVTAADILIPLALSVFCGVGGYFWGLVRFSQGQTRQGWAAFAVNACAWCVGVAIWIVVAVMFSVAVNAVPSPPLGSALGTPAISASVPAKIPEKKPALDHRKRP